MKYREALRIGSAADGIVKCTYAQLFDEDGKVLFSFQRKDAPKGMIYNGVATEENLLTSSRLDWTVVKLNDGIWVEDSRFGGEAGFTLDTEYEIPIVEISGELQNTTLVTCRMIPEAASLLAAKLAKCTVPVWYFWATTKQFGIEQSGVHHKVYGKEPSQKTIKEWEDQSNENHKYYVTMGEEFYQRYDKLMEILEGDRVFYIKPDAFYWQITKLRDNAEYNGLSYQSDRVKKAKEAMDRAMAVLLGVATTNIF